jgi:hypothetical protein
MGCDTRRMGYFSKLACTLVMTVAMLAGMTVTGASAARHMEVAVQDDPVLFQGFYSTPQKGLKLAQQLHTSRVRVNVVWSYVVGRDSRKKKAPKHIKYNWSGYDLLIANAKPFGIKVQLVLTGPAPAWATGNHRKGVYKPKAKAFKAFATAAAKHFKGRGVDRYSIWNEPNYRGWLAPMKSSPKLYRGLYASGYSAIKRADRKAKVFIAETSPYATRRNSIAPLKFLRGVTCANKRYKRAHKCSRLKTDGFAHHPYDFKHKPTYKYPGKDNVTLATLGRLTSALSKLRKAKLLSTPSGGVPYLYLTEWGYFSSGKYKLSSSKQGKYLVQGFKMAQRNKRVKQMLQFLLVKPGGNFRHFDTSIASRGGKPSRAFKMLASWTKKAAKAGQITVPRKR